MSDDKKPNVNRADQSNKERNNPPSANSTNHAVDVSSHSTKPTTDVKSTPSDAGLVNKLDATSIDQNREAEKEKSSNIQATPLNDSATADKRNAAINTDKSAKATQENSNDETLGSKKLTESAGVARSNEHVTNSDKKTEVKSGIGSRGHGGNTPPPRTPNKADKPKRSPLPLLISLIALGLGGYALYQNWQQSQSATAPNAEISTLKTQLGQLQQTLNSKANVDGMDNVQKEVQKLAQQFKTLEQSLAGKADKDAINEGLSETQVNSLISSQIGQYSAQVDQHLQQITAKQQDMAQTQAAGLDKEQVNTLIKEAIANAVLSDNDALDFSEEIDTIKQNKADIQHYIEEIKQQGAAIQASLHETATQAKTTLDEAASQAQTTLDESIGKVEQKITATDNKPLVYPLLNSLTLAEIAANSHQYSIAVQYLEQAVASFDALNLNQAPYAPFAAQITTLKQQTQTLAATQNQQQDIDNIIKSVNNWPFISTNPENLLERKESNSPTISWKDSLQRIGSNVLSKTVTITKNDAAGLTWINENPHLQQIIRENIRLDLGMIRNALLIGDQARAQSVLNTLHEEVGHYFDTEATSVKQALARLDSLVNAQQNVPDIAALIQSIKQID